MLSCHNLGETSFLRGKRWAYHISDTTSWTYQILRNAEMNSLASKRYAAIFKADIGAVKG
jgi:hypothetical protein